MKKETGGMAYPNKTVAGGWDGNRTIAFTHEGGMTVRDYFAAAAMQGHLANPDWLASAQRTAEDAYEIADAMLEARK